MKTPLSPLAIRVLPIVLSVFGWTSHSRATEGDYVSRKEYEELRHEMLELKKELDSIKKQNRATTTKSETASAPAPVAPADGPPTESKDSSPSSLLNTALEDLALGS